MKIHWIILSFILVSCNMEKEIDLDLPEYESKIVVECYLDPGKPFRLTLFESVSYFETPQLPTIDSALVIIKHNGDADTLKFNTTPVGSKFYNYQSDSLVPFDYVNDFVLEVVDKKGRRVSAVTRIPALVPIDTVTFETNDDSLSFPLTKFFDNPSTYNLYRYQVQKTFLGEEVTDFQFDDALFQTTEINLGSNYNLKKNEIIEVSLFHLTREHYDFLESAGAAISANGNPFGQPAVIKSNIEGGIGIFTGVAVDQKSLVAP